MPRRRREDAQGSIHHVWAKGIEGRAIFRRDGDRRDLIERFAEVLPETGTRCLAWALMTNHLHLVLRTGSQPLSTAIQRIHTGYAVGFNRRYGRTGYLFQSRFGSRRVRDEAGLKVVIRYVLANPLEGGIVRDVGALARSPWCGLGALLGVRPALPFEAVAETLSIFGDTESAGRTALRAFMEETHDGETGSPGDAESLLASLVRAVCREQGVPEDELREGCRRRDVSHARTLVCRRAVASGLRPAAVARGLGLSESAVSQALRRRLSEGGGPALS